MRGWNSKRKRKVNMADRCMVQRECKVCNKIPKDGYTLSQVGACDFVCFSCTKAKEAADALAIIEED